MDTLSLWHDMVFSSVSKADLEVTLKEIYKSHNPANLEILLNSHCPGKCRHCIYPPDYHLFNKNISSKQWEIIFAKAYESMGFRVFLFNGRHLENKHIAIIRDLKNRFHDISIGIVVSGNISDEVVDGLIELAPDWVDVSLDGLEDNHDEQRAEKGSYKKTLKILNRLQMSGKIEKINVLTCLTSINAGSVMEMVKFLNRQGFPNFFITPVTIVKGYRPDFKLRPSESQLIKFIDDFLNTASNLQDSWLEFNLFDVGYFSCIQKHRPNIFRTVSLLYDHFEHISEYGENEVHLSYYPSSLTGIRELVLNSNGDIIPPKVIASGKIDKDLIFDNMLTCNLDINFNSRMVEKSAFSFYVSEFLEECEKLTGESILLKKNYIK